MSRDDASPNTIAKMALRKRLIFAASVLLLFFSAILAAFAPTVDAQQRRGRNVPVQPLPQPKAATPQPQPDPTIAAPQPPAPPPRPVETVQADVSTRNVRVTSSFTGTEIVIFGAIDNSQSPSPESGYYDIVVVVEGQPARVVARKKDRVGGIWLNTKGATFDGVPSFYGIESTRPLDEIAPEAVLIGYEIGFEQARMAPVGETTTSLPSTELRQFRQSLIRIKQKDGLFVKDDYGVVFIGRSLFRATVELPANVTPGPFDTNVYLFRDQRLLSQYRVTINLEREGLERFLHTSAYNAPFYYGLATVLLALLTGLSASILLSKSSH
jgi:uncharacterized protein (TIGR02186 family)